MLTDTLPNTRISAEMKAALDAKPNTSEFIRDAIAQALSGAQKPSRPLPKEKPVSGRNRLYDATQAKRLVDYLKANGPTHRNRVMADLWPQQTKRQRYIGQGKVDQERGYLSAMSEQISVSADDHMLSLIA